MTARVSVVIDNYNYGRYLGEAVESVLAQDFAGGIECIVVDDGSTDESRRVISGFGERVRAILQENQGQASAFNAGFAAATAPIVCLLDSDDYWSPDKLKKIVPLFDDPQVGVAQHLLQDVDAVGRPLPQHRPDWPDRYTLEDFLDRRVEFTATSGLAFRRSALSRALPIPRDVFYYLDDMLVVKCLLDSKLANICEVLGFHRMHESNFCAGGYQFDDPKRLELDLRMRAIFNREIDPLLERRGLRKTARYGAEEELELMRRRLLLHMHRGERLQALGEWLRMFGKYGTRRFGAFRCLTCALALLSPALYLRFYRYYSAGVLPRLRSRLFPS